MATVMLRSGASKTMADLVVGDEVLVEEGTYSKVFMFTTRDDVVKQIYIRVEVQASSFASAALELTTGHFLYVWNGRSRDNWDPQN